MTGTGSLLGTASDNLQKAHAEIDRLNKVVDQAIECELVNPPSTKYHPEIAAELARRGK